MFDSPIVKRLIALAIEEDLALGDATAQAAVDADLRGSARIVAREKMVACCLPLIAGIFESLRWPAEGGKPAFGFLLRCHLLLQAPPASLSNSISNR